MALGVMERWGRVAGWAGRKKVLQVSTGPMEERQERVFLQEAELSCMHGRI